MSRSKAFKGNGSSSGCANNAKHQMDGSNILHSNWYSQFLAVMLTVAGCEGKEATQDDQSGDIFLRNHVNSITIDNNFDHSNDAIFGRLYNIQQRIYEWLVDSGATIHVVGDISYLSKVTDRNPRGRLRVANGESCQVQAIGEAILELPDARTGQKKRITLHNVHVCPGIDTCVISTRRLWKDNRIRTKFGARNTLKTLDGDIFEMRDAANGHYYMENKCNAISSDIIHARLGHCGERRTKLAAERSVGLDLSQYKHPTDCDPCLQGGDKRRFYKHGSKDKDWSKFGETVSVHGVVGGEFVACGCCQAF